MSEYSKYGDYKLNTLTLTTNLGETISLASVFTELSIFESIYNKSISAKLSIIDGNDISYKLNIQGGETVSVSFNTAGVQTKIKCDFVVYKMSAPATNERLEHITLYLTTKDNYKSLRTKICQVYEGTSDVIVADILKTISSTVPISSTPSVYTRRYIPPSICPLDAIEYVSRQAMHTSNAQEFLFYETTVGYVFKPISELYTQQTSHVYNKQYLINFDTEDERNQAVFSNISEIDEHERFTRIADITDGVYSNVHVSYDILNKTITQTTNNRSMFPTLAKTLNVFDEGTADKRNITVHNAFVNELVQPVQNPLTRACMLLGLNNGVTVTVSGNSNIHAGNIVELEILSCQSSDEKDAVDKQQSGKRIITNLRHTITQSEYTCTFDAFMDGMNG